MRVLDMPTGAIPSRSEPGLYEKNTLVAPGRGIKMVLGSPPMAMQTLGMQWLRAMQQGIPENHAPGLRSQHSGSGA